MSDRAQRLQRLLVMIKDIELDRLSALSAQVRDAQTASEELQKTQDRRAQQIAQLAAPDPALTVGVDEKWRQWSRIEAMRLQEEIEEISARHEEQRRLAGRALGRMRAFDGLQARLREREVR